MRPLTPEAAAHVVATGGVLVYPTATLWGIGGDARVAGVVERVQRLKGRSGSPFLLLVRGESDVEELATVVPASARRLMAAIWPGHLTLLLPASPSAPACVVGAEGLVGLRVPGHPVPRALLQATGAWLVSTSANPTGAAAPLRLSDIEPVICAAVDGVVVGPPAPTGTASTIVAIGPDGAARLVRAGEVGRGRLEAVLGSPLQVHELCPGT